MFSTWNEFSYNLRASNDLIVFRPIYGRICGNDLVAGILLAEIVYWFLPDKHNKPKLSIFREGKMWIARKRYEWWERTFLSPKQVDKALRKLGKLGLIERRVFKFDNAPTTHIHLNQDVFLKLWNDTVFEPLKNPYAPDENTQKENPNFPKGQIPTSQKGNFKTDVRGSSLTETTTETTEKDIVPGGTASADPHDDAKSTVSNETPAPAETPAPSHTTDLDGLSERDRIFNGVAAHSFNLDWRNPEHKGLLITSAARIGRAVKLLYGSMHVTPEELARFYAWYKRQYPGAAVPKDAGKLGEHLAAYREEKKKRDSMYQERTDIDNTFSEPPSATSHLMTFNPPDDTDKKARRDEYT